MAEKKQSVSRWGVGIRLVVQIACVVFLVIAANVVGFKYFVRSDFSRSQKFALAEQTKQVLNGLSRPVRVIVYFSGANLSLESALYRDVQNLLREYQFSSQGRIEVEYVDPARDLSRALELQAKYEFDADQNVLIIDDESGQEVLPIVEMGEFDFSGVPMGEPARLIAFRGEEVLTSALLKLLNPEQHVVLAIEGHGEIPLERMNILRLALERQNASLQPLNLSNVLSVPEDAAAIVIAGPEYDLSTEDVGKIRRYWESNGRILVALDPNADLPNLIGWVKSLGVVPNDNRVVMVAPSPTRPGFFGIFKDVPGIFLPGSVITKRLESVNGMFPAATQTLSADQAVAEKADLSIRPLIGAPEQFWGESNHRQMTEGLQYDHGSDVGQPFAIALAVERGGTEDERVEVAAAKAVIVGNRDFLQDSVVERAGANLDFVISVLNWMFERSRLTGITPKTVAQFSLSLTPAQMDRIALYVMVVIPGAVAVIGLIVALRRRA